MSNSLKKCLRKVYTPLREWGYATATRISPKWNNAMRYRAAFGKKPNLDDPQTFSEKLLWLKFNRYNGNPLVVQCADKYRVRDYITQCGCGDILNDLIGVWDKAEDIPWDTLPDKFALKWNFGAGMNIICTDKAALSREQTVRQLNEWRRNKCWLSHAEMHYRDIDKKIICETFLEVPQAQVIPDFKVYCFHGKPQAILVMHDRGSGVKTEFFDTDWQKLDNSAKYSAPTTQTEKPACLERLLSVCETLSAPFPFVRCDFYIIGERIVFGELTFTPAAGIYTSQTVIHGKTMAELLDIDRVKAEG